MTAVPVAIRRHAAELFRRPPMPELRKLAVALTAAIRARA
jgi:hypothetical protein